MEIANGLTMWVACGLPVLFVLFQAVLFLRKAVGAGKELGLTKLQVKTAIRSSAITSIGPSIVVLSGMLALLVTVGAPVGWMRLSLIGSVMFESIAAGLGTAAVGVTLGTDPMTLEALTMAIWTMILCSIGWIIFATFSANRMDNIEQRLSKGNAGTLTSIASCAIIGVFAAMSASHLSKPLYLIVKQAEAVMMTSAWRNMISCILGAAIMYVLTIS